MRSTSATGAGKWVATICFSADLPVVRQLRGERAASLGKSACIPNQTARFKTMPTAVNRGERRAQTQIAAQPFDVGPAEEYPEKAGHERRPGGEQGAGGRGHDRSQGARMIPAAQVECNLHVGSAQVAAQPSAKQLAEINQLIDDGKLKTEVAMVSRSRR